SHRRRHGTRHRHDLAVLRRHALKRSGVHGLAALACVALALGMAACASQSGSLNGDTFGARKKLTRELISRGDWASAFAYADSMHRERPKDAEVLLLRGTIYRERGLSREAEADLLASLSLDDGAAETHAALGILYDVTLRPALAEPQHRAAVKLAP